MRPPRTHERLGPLHVVQSPNWQLSAPSQLPALPPVSQHIIMSRPQSLGSGSQRPVVALQSSAGSHTPRGAHGWSMPPTSVGRMHAPETQRSVPSHSVPPG